MPVRTDAPPQTAHGLIEAAMAARHPHRAHLRLDGPIAVTRPILHRYYTVSSRDPPAFRLRRLRSWDYFLVAGEAVAVASLRQSGDALAFEGLTGGAIAPRLFEAVSLASRELGGGRIVFAIRLFECRAAKLLSLVLQPRSGTGYYVNVVDKSLVAGTELSLVKDLQSLRELARDRLAVARQPSAAMLIQR